MQNSALNGFDVVMALIVFPNSNVVPQIVLWKEPALHIIVIFFENVLSDVNRQPLSCMNDERALGF